MLSNIIFRFYLKEYHDKFMSMSKKAVYKRLFHVKIISVFLIYFLYKATDFTVTGWEIFFSPRQID